MSLCQCLQEVPSLEACLNARDICATCRNADSTACRGHSQGPRASDNVCPRHEPILHSGGFDESHDKVHKDTGRGPATETSHVQTTTPCTAVASSPKSF